MVNQRQVIKVTEKDSASQIVDMLLTYNLHVINISIRLQWMDGWMDGNNIKIRSEQGTAFA